MKKDFAASLLKKIHKQKISPRERYYFIAKTVLNVLALTFFLLFGMLAVAIVLHLAHNIVFLEFMWEQPRVFMKVLLFGVPLFWMVVAVALWIVTEKMMQQTDRGYRIQFWIIGVVALVIQIGGGLALEQSRVGEHADAAFEVRMEWYHGADRINRQFQRSPEQGFLAGTVMKVESNELVLLNDVTGKKWKVSLVLKAIPRHKLEEGMDVRLVGEMLSEDEFAAAAWRPAGDRPLLGKSMQLFRRKGERGMRPPLFNRLREEREF